MTTHTSANRAPAIAVDHLQKRYGDRVVIGDVSFSVHEGEIFGLLGANGAGKTTTVECVGGLRRRDGGAIRVFGLDPDDAHPAFRTAVGIQLQESRLPDKITVDEALELYASFYPNPHSRDVLLDRLGLGDQRRTYFAKLSGGQKQRLSVALALIGRPRVAILDELTTGLDPQARREVWTMLEELRDDGVTLLLVSHFMEEAQRLCDRVAVIDAGRVVALDSPDGLAASVDTRQRFTFEPSPPIEATELTRLPSVTDVTTDGRRMTVAGTGDVVGDVLVELRRLGVTAGRLRLDQADLEDAFVSLITEKDNS